MTGVNVQIQGLGYAYRNAQGEVNVLDGVNVDLKAGESVAIVGPSGSGKSTFMHLLGLLDRPTRGVLSYDGQDTGTLTEQERDLWRNRNIGFVFQSHNLLPEQTALDNVMIPVRLSGGAPEVARQRAELLLGAVGLSKRHHHLPGELSGGEQQRVAIARALVMGPRLVLADEPTGNLDPSTAVGVFDLLMSLNTQLGSNLVIVTHSSELASRFPRQLRLDAGRFVEA